MHHTIGDEFAWAREGMTDELLCKDGLQVSEVTTDPDSSAGRAADSSTKTVRSATIEAGVVFNMRHFSKIIKKSNKTTKLS